MIEYRLLNKEEIERLGEVNRQELIEKWYYMADGQLEYKDVHYDVKGFHPEEVKELIRRTQKLSDQGGKVYGAFFEAELVGIVSLEKKFRGQHQDTMKLDILYVSHSHRQQGVGSKLMELASEEARKAGARKLYISATPSENTLNFYLGLGAELCSEVDPELFSMEPEDIHLELRLEKE